VTTRRRTALTPRLLSGLAIALGVCAASVFAQSAPDSLIGRRLEDALRALQTQGLRLVFSSELVTADMRVRAEPRSKTARERLAELLQPHGLVAESGPGGIIQIVRLRRLPVERPRRAALPASPPRTGAGDPRVSPVGDTWRERVTVTAHADPADEVSAGIDRQLASDELRALGGYITDDPLRVVQALPGVATGDDFRSEFSVRGSAWRQSGVIVDGVAAPWLFHAAPGRGDTGTMTMVPGGLVEAAALHVGAYARVDSSQLGPQLNLTLREGSRTQRRFALGVSGASATLTAEGPIGSASRGSWLVGVRRSHNEWPVGRNDEHSTVFGFGDVQSKVVYDVRPRQQVSVVVVAGLSNIERENPNPLAPGDGLNRGALIGLAWRSVIGSGTIVTHRVSSLAHDCSNRNQTAEGAGRGANRADMYRVDLSQPLFRGVIEAGGQVRRVRGSRHGMTRSGSVPIPEGMEPTFDDSGASWLERAGYASFRRPIGSGLVVAAGLRWSDSTLVRRRAVDRWLRAEWSVASRWLVHGSTGVMHQFPALEQIAGWADPASLRPERAAFVDLGVGQRLSAAVRWDATVFVRRERDVLRERDLHPRLIDGMLDVDHNATRVENALTGSARGIELALARRSQTGLAGWIGYSYGVARHADTARQEAFRSDFDQRHTINVSGSTALPWKARLSLTLRGGTNVPIPGYFAIRNKELVVGGERNQARLPAYARLDVRAERAFDRRARRFTLFAETLNLLNRANLGPADGTILHDSGAAVGFTERLLPRLLTAGLRFEL
jgi:hypothetical protein